MKRFGGPILVLATVAVVALAAPSAIASGSGDNALMLAESVPVPKPNPRRPAADDPIGELIQGDARPAADDAGPAPQPAKSDTLGDVGFRVAVQLLRDGNPAAATLAAYALPDRVSADVVDWLVATSGDDGVPSERIAAVADRLSDWPGGSLMQLRLEQALEREEASDAEILEALSGRTPETHAAAMIVGRALLAAGRRDEAAQRVRDLWREARFDEDTEKAFAETFADLLSDADHKARMDLMFYDEQVTLGLRAAKRLDKAQRALADAVAASIRGRSNAESRLRAVPEAARTDPLYIYARVILLRRAEKASRAADLLAAVPSDAASLVDPDSWWVERRIVSRTLAEYGKYRAAYAVAAAHAAESASRRAEAEFHAGWYALEYLNEPDIAAGHFARILEIASRPLSLSRAEYWLGRAAGAADDREAAERHFRRAAAFPTTFYGQLALVETGHGELPLAIAPAPSGEDAERFGERRFVRVIERLVDANYADRTGSFFRLLASRIDDAAEIRLLAEMAEAAGQHQVALQVGILANGRGVPVDDLAFPDAAIPSDAEFGNVDPAIVYAIARQESRFNPEAASGAGARGLLQLMPGTAREVARGLGLRYSRGRLTSDPAYNATLGASYIDTLLERFAGSYVMAFAAYNAGASRVDDWVERFGDPRDPKVDVVNWIESIPFTETRNYVQRVMENLQVYRARFGNRALTLHLDLRRGGPG